MSVNKVIVVGNLGRDPEVRALPSGQNVANFSVATKARFKDRNGEQQERTEWHRVVAFGKLADTCQRLLSQGTPSLRRGTADDPPVRSEGRKRQPLSDRDRSAANALCSEIARTATRPRQKHPTIFRSDHINQREPRKRLSLSNTKNPISETTTMDVYAIVTEKIINLLEQGVVPWRRPWT